MTLVPAWEGSYVARYFLGTIHVHTDGRRYYRMHTFAKEICTLDEERRPNILRGHTVFGHAGNSCFGSDGLERLSS